MIFYAINQFWSQYGWYFIFFGSIISLFILWVINRSSGSTGTTFQSIIDRIFSPVFPAVSLPSTPASNHQETKSSKGETKCREFLEYLFHKKFDNVRPDFLVNPITNQCLELDCYNEELKLAVEYQGKQHYEYNRMMHQNSKHAFQNQKYRDHIKREICKEQGIQLIEVPYTISVEKIPDFLYAELKKLGYINSVLVQPNSQDL